MEDDQPLMEPVENDLDDMDEDPGVQVQPLHEEPAAEAKPMETEFSGFYEWEIHNYASLKTEKQTSETFEVGTYLWRLLCFPRGNAAPYKHVSVFLWYPEADYTPHHLSPKASFKLSIKNHKDPAKDYFKEASHTFNSGQADWGFAQMVPLADLASCYLREDGALVVRVDITIQRDERFSYDSRAETGHVGLKNQGATCYMNSLLQYLYLLPAFRKAVYHMPVPENEEPSKSLPVALQSLFYKLQYARGAVSTKELTKSFGWNTYDAFMQHDVQELNRVLCEKLEEKMKNTTVEKIINELFEGMTYNFLECINVEYKSTRKESFADLQLDVKGCKDIYDSFDRYTEVEVMNGVNQYKTDDFGMQDARKGILFEKLPPVLQLQLKRFEYDFQRDAMVKINDRYQFYDTLDLDREGGRYLAPGADRSVRNIYRLHSVLVHSGGVHGGHYYAYIRPDGKQWLKFDDERVTREEERQAMDGQFGGSGADDDYTLSTTGPAPPPLKYAKSSNAYMLVYVREVDWPAVMCEVTKEDIAKHLLSRLEQEMADKEARQRDKAEAHLYCSLKVATDEDFAQQVGSASAFDLVDHDRLPAERCHYRLRKQTKFEDFKNEVARRTGVPPAQQRYWGWKRRTNGTYRPERLLGPGEEGGQLVDLKDFRDLPADGVAHGGAGAGGGAKSALMDIRLYLERPDDEGRFPPVLPASKVTPPPPPSGAWGVLLFFKVYDPLTETVKFAGHHVLGWESKVEGIANLLAEDLQMDAQGEGQEAQGPPPRVLIWEEVKFEPHVMMEPLLPGKTLRDHELGHGDVLVYQREVGPAEVPQPRYPTAPEYMSYVHNRRQVHFKRLEEPGGPPAVTLELLRQSTYDEVCAALAAALSPPADPAHLRLTKHNYFSAQPQRQPVRWRSAASLEALLTHNHHAVDTLYFELLDLPLEQAEQLKTVRVSFHNERGEFVGEQHAMRLRREASVADLLAELAARLQQAAAAATAATAPSTASASDGGGPAASETASSSPPAPGTPPPAAPAAAGPPSAGGAAAAGVGPASTTASSAADDLAAAAAALAAGRPLRLLEISQNRIYKVIEPSQTVEDLNDTYWLLRAELVPEDQLAAALGPGDRLLHVSHSTYPPMTPAVAATLAAVQARDAAALEPAAEGAAAAQGHGEAGAMLEVTSEAEEALETALVTQMPGPSFGDPFLVRVHANDTLGSLKARIQAYLGTPPSEFARWRSLMVGSRPNNAMLPDDQDMTVYFGDHNNKLALPPVAAAAAGGPTQGTLMDPNALHLALLHEDKGGPTRRQPPAATRYNYEKPVKIYG